MAQIALIGSGISSLATAWQLTCAGHECTVFEREDCVGGAIQSYREGPYLAEEGPNSIQLNNPEIEAFFETIPGLMERMITADASAHNRFIVRSGALHKVPTSPISAITTQLWSMAGKLRVLKEPFIGAAPSDAEESVADFVRRRLGNELYEYAINPLVGGIYAGNPEKLSLKHGFPKLYALDQNHGGLIRGSIAKLREKRSNQPANPQFKKRIISFKEGLNELPSTIAAGLGKAIHLNCQLTAISQCDSRWRIDWIEDRQKMSATFDRLIVTTPSHAITKLPFESGLRDRLIPITSIEYPPISVLTVAYKRSDVTHPLNGFGALVPEKEGRTVLGILFPSSVFAGRAPADEIVLTIFVGGTRQPELATDNKETLIRTIGPDLKALLGVSGPPSFAHLRYWDKAIPQYTLGYGAYLDAIDSIEKEHAGLHLFGNYRSGISLSYCLESALRSVEELGL